MDKSDLQSKRTIPETQPHHLGCDIPVGRYGATDNSVAVVVVVVWGGTAIPATATVDGGGGIVALECL